MAGTLYGYPFDEEIFNYMWRNEPDPVTTALIDSGVVQENGEIASMISNGSDTYTIPFYNLLGEVQPANYDGKTDMPVAEATGASQSGIVFGRMQGWKSRDFIVDFNSGAEPMAQIASQVARWWRKYEQKLIVKILGAVFGITDPGTFTGWKDHMTDITSDESVAESNKLNETSFGDAAQKACGDLASGMFNVAIMHSAVANHLAHLDLLEFRKYTDPSGMQRQLPIADANGYTIIEFDGVPVDTSKPEAPKYTTYLLGAGALQHANAPVKVPVEADRDPVKNGGEEMLYTRRRESYHVNGFTFKAEAEDHPSPTDENLGNKDRYKPVYDPKCIALAQIVSNG